MSVYSGFATRQQETNYNAYLERMVFLLSKRTLWEMRDEKFDDAKWRDTFSKLYKNMYIMEKNKYLLPKFTETIHELADFIGVRPSQKEDWILDNLSRISSRSNSRVSKHSYRYYRYNSEQFNSPQNRLKLMQIPQDTEEDLENNSQLIKLEPSQPKLGSKRNSVTIQNYTYTLRPLLQKNPSFTMQEYSNLISTKKPSLQNTPKSSSKMTSDLKPLCTPDSAQKSSSQKNYYGSSNKTINSRSRRFITESSTRTKNTLNTTLNDTYLTTEESYPYWKKGTDSKPMLNRDGSRRDSQQSSKKDSLMSTRKDNSFDSKLKTSESRSTKQNPAEMTPAKNPNIELVRKSLRSRDSPSNTKEKTGPQTVLVGKIDSAFNTTNALSTKAFDVESADKEFNITENPDNQVSQKLF